jgi:solute carrier family 6 amino acid transporter-like protein 5/7/9/14
VCDDLEFMLGKKTGAYWRICWGFVTPVLMLVILVYSVATMEPEKYNDQPFPTAAYGKIINRLYIFMKTLKSSHVV